MKSALKNNIQLLLVLVTMCTSCDKKDDAIKKFNLSPQINIVTSEMNNVHTFSKYKADSLRINDLEKSSQKIKIKYVDINKNIANVKVYSSSNSAVLRHHGRIVKDLLPIDEDTIELDFENSEEELTTLEFTITDKLGSADKVTYTILTFNNLAPISILEIRPETGQKYTIDASKSYDEDKNHGGKIEWYIFNINGSEIKSRKPILKQHFNEKDIYKIELKTIDNQNSTSKPVYQTVVLS